MNMLLQMYLSLPVTRIDVRTHAYVVLCELPGKAQTVGQREGD